MGLRGRDGVQGKTAERGRGSFALRNRHARCAGDGLRTVARAL